jgi:hypothetical protein
VRDFPRGARWWIVVVVVGLLAGCIQPVEPEPTPGAQNAPVQPPGADSAVPAAPAGDSASLLPVIEQFIRDRGEEPGSLQTWPEQPLGPDQVRGYSFTNAAGASCVGFLLTAVADGLQQPINGALLCAPAPDVTALASVWVFLTSDGQSFTLVFGRVEDPTISAIAVVFSDGSNRTVNPSLGGFLIPQPGIMDVNVVTAINAEGNTVIAEIPLSPAR